MKQPFLDVRIPGRPALLTAPPAPALAWKQAVAAAVAARWPGGWLAEPCAVTLRFGLEPARMRDTALFNLLKATLDGLGSVVFAPATSGQVGPWNTEDWWIHRLLVSKHQAPASELRIVVSGIGEAVPLPPDPIVAWGVERVVPGPPPLWIGHGYTTRYARYLAAFQDAPAPPPGVPLAVIWRFILPPEKMAQADLDNYIVPAAQALGQALFGNIRQGPSIHALAAEKVPASAGELSGTWVRVWQTAAGNSDSWLMAADL